MSCSVRNATMVASGTGGLSVAFDLPTQMGYDSDDRDRLWMRGRAVGSPPTPRLSTNLRIRACVAIEARRSRLNGIGPPASRSQLGELGPRN
jgi:hypothetical protein